MGQVRVRGGVAALALAAVACAAVPPRPVDPYGAACRALSAEVSALALDAACRGDADCVAVDVRGQPGCCWLATAAPGSLALEAALARAERSCPRVDKGCPRHCTVRCEAGRCRAPPHCNADPSCGRVSAAAPAASPGPGR